MPQATDGRFSTHATDHGIQGEEVSEETWYTSEGQVSVCLDVCEYRTTERKKTTKQSKREEG
jgi:hypothetical protein